MQVFFLVTTFNITTLMNAFTGKNCCMFLHHHQMLSKLWFSLSMWFPWFLLIQYGPMSKVRKNNEIFFFWPPFFLMDLQFTARVQKSWASPLTRDKPLGNEQTRKWGLQKRCMNTTPCRGEQIAGCKMPSRHGWEVHEGHLRMESTATAGRILVRKWVQTKEGESLLKPVEVQRSPEGWGKWTSRKLRSFLHLNWATSNPVPDYFWVYKSPTLPSSYVTNNTLQLCNITLHTTHSFIWQTE